MPAGHILNLGSTPFLVENQASIPLYITPITDTYAEPKLILQSKVRFKNFEVAPGETIELEYDSFDFGLSGLIVCTADNACKMINYEGSNVVISNFDSLPDPNPSWLKAVENAPNIAVSFILFPLLGLLSILLFFLGLRLDFGDFRTQENKSKAIANSVQ